MALGISVVSAVPAAAQDENGQLGIGYQFINFSDLETSFPLGFNVDYVYPLNVSNLSVLGELGWSRHSEEIIPGEDGTISLLNFGAGMRWTPELEAAVAPYVQVVVGLQRSTVSAFDESDSSSDFMWQPGGGVAFPLNDMWDLFGEVGLRQVFFEGDSDFGVRLVIGGRVGL